MNDFDFEIPDLIGKYLPETNELKILSVIGYGSFAVVYKAEDADGNLFAVKCIVKKGLNPFQLKLQYREAELLQSLENHPNIVNLYQVIDTEENLFMVLDLCECDLFEAIVHNHGFDNEYTKEVFEILIDTVQYLHDRHIYHRDLKPENILITADGDIKIADFGLACSDNWSSDFECGTLRYEPPECVDPSSKGYSPEKSDLWALGVILVNLRFERNPWAYASPEDNVYYEFSTSNCNVLQQQLGLSNDMNDILKNIFKIDPNQRWSLVQIKEALYAIDEMYDETKYNPLPPKKSNHTTPIPITPHSKKGSPFSCTFSSSNSSTYNNSPGFVKQYEDQMESGYYANNEKEYAIHDQTYTNSKYDHYFLNHHSLSHFSFCSRHEEEEDEDEEKQDTEDEECDYEADHEVPDLSKDKVKDKEKNMKKKRGRHPHLKIFSREIENETFYLEDEHYSPRDNRLYRSIKKGSICSRHGSIRNLANGGTNGSIRTPFEAKHNNHVMRPTPLRINTNMFPPEEESLYDEEVKSNNHSDDSDHEELYAGHNKLTPLDHEVPESWEDYTFDDLVSEGSSDEVTREQEKNFVTMNEHIKSLPTPVFKEDQEPQTLEKEFDALNLKIRSLPTPVMKPENRSSTPQIFADKIASFYKNQVIGYIGEDRKNEIESKITLNEKSPEETFMTAHKVEVVHSPVETEPVKFYQAEIFESSQETVFEEDLQELEEVKVEDNQCKALIDIQNFPCFIKNFSLISSSFQGRNEDDDQTFHLPLQWKANSFIAKHSLLVHFNEISLLNINFLWMSYQPTNYAFLLKYYIPELPLYLFIFSYQYLERMIQCPYFMDSPYSTILHQDDPLDYSRDYSKKKTKDGHTEGPSTQDQDQNNTNHSKSKETRMIGIKPFSYSSFRSFMSKQKNYLYDQLSILMIKIIQKIIDLYQFSVKFKSSRIKVNNSYPNSLDVNGIEGDTGLTSIESITINPSCKDVNNPFYQSSFVKFVVSDLAKNTFNSLEMMFLFLIEKFKLSFLMMFIISFQRKYFSIVGLNSKSFMIHSKITEKLIILFQHFYSKYLYLLLRTSFI